MRASLALLVLVAACDAPDASAPSEPIVVTDLASYGAACEAALGTFPDFDCFEGVEVPVRVTAGGVTRDVVTYDDLENGACDKPLGVGGCVPRSRVGTKVNERGSTFTFVCRAYEFRDETLFDDLGVIAQNPDTGDTCFWAVPIDGHTFDGTFIPKPASAEDDTFFPDRPFWYRLHEIADANCTRCHDNDPYIHTPAFEQTGVLPSHPLAPYRPVQGPGFTPARKLVHPDAAACTACHRIGDRFTCDLARYAAGRPSDFYERTQAYRQWPRSHWMDRFEATGDVFPTEADWNAVYASAVDAIESCCDQPTQPGCWSDHGE